MSNTEELDNKATQYLIPANVSARFEIFEGFGWAEFKPVIIALVIGGLLFYTAGLFKRSDRYDLGNLPVERSIGLKQGKNIVINGDTAIIKSDAIPMLMRLFLVIIPTAGTFIFVRRDPLTKLSLMSTIKLSREFHKRQKLYLYVSGSEVG